ncbi:cation:proton antiporter [Chamaesiphon minutus]|uniref:Kef-type K+ transport system, membrane component n=1 Tax=Chamaesiphon minutus (strain ATCC 27169 / PCC 6605) TaxID=1173020 RepID=K9UAW3_CHAP6|nr:cation:proton antiporter [Chamaesiphon minutus]AFY91985.1 Kef-type K+ transport system, membrane component [Chamaesiphon minutus PCC 6605]
MLEDFRLIVDLVSILAAAAVGGIIAGLAKQPPLLGYIVGGAIVGPTGLGLIKELVPVETLAQFGAAFLLFALGVEFSFAELKKVQKISLGGGGLQILLTILVTTVISVSVGWVATPQQGVFLGAILSLSSTAVVLKSLMESNETATPHGQVMLGILVVQDLALGFMLAVLPALDRPPAEIGMAVLYAAVKIGLFAIGATITGIWVVPRLLRLLASTESQELFLLGVVTLCLGIALITEHLGLSIEMGAFVAGLMISEAEYADQTLAYVEPIRDVFAALFFAAIGMLIDPRFLWENLDLILGLVSIVFIGKFAIITPLVRLFGYPLQTALIAGLGLAQIGEFSFVLASEGRNLGLVSRRVYLLLLGTTAVTLVVTPFILRLIPSLFNWIESVPSLDRWFQPGDPPLEVSEHVPLEPPIVICGYGRTGQNLATLLAEQNVPVVVVDQSESAIQRLRESGTPYIYGNAVSIPVLTRAGLDRARAMVIALPDAMSTRLCLKHALEISPELDIVVRANQYQDIELLYQLGGSEVVQPEFEASLEMASHLLVKIGLPTVQIQRQVKAIRNSHYMELRPEGTIGESSQNIQAATLGMNRRWYRLSLTSPLLGNSIASANIRTLTGATIVAIQREDGTQINYPNGGTTFNLGDSCLVIGSVEEQTMFDLLTKGEISIPVLPLSVLETFPEAIVEREVS